MTYAPRPRAALALLGLLVLGAGCEPTCRNTCEKLLDCEDTTVDQPRVSLDECEDACEVQQALYAEDWENEQLRDGLADLKRCVRDEECDAIAEGACYDPDLYIF